jgi:hypothetical protein
MAPDAAGKAVNCAYGRRDASRMASMWDNQYELAPMTSSGHKSGERIAAQTADDRTKVESWGRRTCNEAELRWLASILWICHVIRLVIV